VHDRPVTQISRHRRFFGREGEITDIGEYGGGLGAVPEQGPGAKPLVVGSWVFAPRS